MSFAQPVDGPPGASPAAPRIGLAGAVEVPSPAPGPPADVDAFRRAAGRFATGVTVMTTRVGHTDHAMTANAFTSVSLDPLVVLVCVEREARFHDAVLESGLWAVNVLAASQQPAAAWFAARGRPLHGQLDRVAHAPGSRTGAALLAGSLATLECATRDVVDGGDHTVVLGDVLAVAVPPTEEAPLLYYRGAYARLG